MQRHGRGTARLLEDEPGPRKTLAGELRTLLAEQIGALTRPSQKQERLLDRLRSPEIRALVPVLAEAAAQARRENLPELQAQLEDVRVVLQTIASAVEGPPEDTSRQRARSGTGKALPAKAPPGAPLEAGTIETSPMTSPRQSDPKVR